MQIELAPNDTLADLKYKIALEIGIREDCQRVFLEGMEEWLTEQSWPVAPGTTRF